MNRTVQVASGDIARTAVAPGVLQWHQANPQQVQPGTFSAGSWKGRALFTAPAMATGKAVQEELGPGIYAHVPSPAWALPWHEHRDLQGDAPGQSVSSGKQLEMPKAWPEVRLSIHRPHCCFIFLPLPGMLPHVDAALGREVLVWLCDQGAHEP